MTLMYKKAGIVIAILLVAAGIIVLTVSSCSKDGGIKLEQTSEGVIESNIDKDDNENIDIKEKDSEHDVDNDANNNADNKDEVISENNDEEDLSTLEIIDDTSEEKVDTSVEVVELSKEEKIESSNESSLSDEEKSALEELKEYKNKKELSEESSKHVEESSGQESKIDADNSAEGLEYKEINMNDLPEKTQKKTVYGIITGKEVLIQGNSVFTTILILDENSDSYRYFVPMSAYESLEKGTKLEVSIVVYFDENKSIKQVTGVSIAE